ncbi:hypothetical protein BDZ94DRAFT_1189853 [Collybia nuda]|uniref:SWIM-type domain-containing protein n=1 Tax=Collybia nuda TaxID=64659 RepID=A0A9P6CLP7_9AGAR|nr:hypothetical protein BDZ94DRAFT_1189853 [Collybia nuda]
MLSSELAHLVAIMLQSVDHAELGVQSMLDDLMTKFRSVLPENVIIAALDIIDKENVIKYSTPWSYPHYEVHGSAATYKVTLDMIMSPIPFYCSCSAFTYAVLIGGSHIVCKHILATCLADKFSLCTERPITQIDLETLIARRHSNAIDM